MNKLMKYELRKTLATKLILLGVTAVAEIVYLLGLYLDKNNMMGVGMVALTILAVGGILIIGLSSLLTLHQDMNTRQSYMLFMTPNSCYKILGAKVLENGLSILLAGAFYFALGALDIALLFAHSGNIQELWNMIEQVIHTINQSIQIDAAGIASLLFSVLTAWIATVTAAYLADVVSAALLNGKKHNGLLSFALFLVIDLLISWIMRKVTGGVAVINTRFVLQGVISLGFAGLMYIGTAEIMERKLSV